PFTSGVVEVNGLSPGGEVLIGEHRGQRGHVRAVRAQMVIYHVEVNGHSQAVRVVDQPPQVVRLAIRPGRGEKSSRIVPPVPPAGEVGNRHQLDGGYAQILQIRQSLSNPVERALGRKRPDVQLVEDQVFARYALPLDVPPSVSSWIDDHRMAMHTFRLIPRDRVRY